ncbi:unnamed protein product [Boreogadus saida]
MSPTGSVSIASAPPRGLSVRAGFKERVRRCSVEVPDSDSLSLGYQTMTAGAERAFRARPSTKIELYGNGYVFTVVLQCFAILCTGCVGGAWCRGPITNHLHFLSSSQKWKHSP